MKRGLMAALVLLAAAPMAEAQMAGRGGLEPNLRDRMQTDMNNLKNDEVAAARSGFTTAIDEARVAQDRGDYEAARRLWRRLADSDVPVAQFSLGMLCERGQGALPDDAQAVKWFRKSADLGFGPAELSLGMMYLSGRGIGQDDREGARWVRLAADQGLPPAEFNLGVLYENGRGVRRDAAAAAAWYRKAQRAAPKMSAESPTCCSGLR
jgi:TPR repeat protein